MNVLVIEDSADATVNLREILAFEGCGMVAVRSVQEAAKHSDWSRIGAVLVDGCPADGTADALLPGLQEAAPNAPAFVITGHADLVAALAALRDRTDTGLVRPISPAELRTNLARVAGLRRNEKQVVQAARLAGVGELAASVAHELNNALGTVTLRLEGLLARTAGDDPRRHALEVVDQEVERMASLVGNLLEFTRAGRGRPSTVDVCDEVTKTTELTAHHLNRKGVRVVPEFAPDVSLVQADRQHLRQVLLNLFTNAADAMPDGGRLTVRVRHGELPDGRSGVVVEVADTGTGIPPEVLPRVTEPFFTTKEEGKGTGLGLAICKRIVDQHDGELGIESQAGVGTTIRVTLPARPRPPINETGVGYVPAS
jgi:signal transduction histidine kinase